MTELTFNIKGHTTFDAVHVQFYEFLNYCKVNLMAFCFILHRRLMQLEFCLELARRISVVSETNTLVFEVAAVLFAEGGIEPSDCVSIILPRQRTCMTQHLECCLLSSLSSSPRQRQLDWNGLAF